MSIRRPLTFLLTIAIAATFWGILSCELGSCEEKELQTQATDSQQVFNERIMPIFRSSDPSSCVQCHLTSVDLKNYILPSHEKTFVSLRDQGLISLDEPKESKILALIQMGDRDRDKGAKLIHEKMRIAEYEAFASWIEACCQDERLRSLPKIDQSELARPAAPDEVIRHARKSRVVDSFVRNIWSQRMRCFPCHTPNEIGPRQANALKKFKELEFEHGERMRIFLKTPEQTLDQLIKRSRDVDEGDLPLINLKQPDKSLLILKPTSKLPLKEGEDFLAPSNAEPVSHMGGLKMHVDDQSYKSFVAWLEDYSNVVAGNYKSIDQLPADNWYATKRVLRMKDVPSSWDKAARLQLFVFAQSSGGGWTEDPIAFTQGTVTPRGLVNGALFLLAPIDPTKREQWRNSEKHLPPGNYLVKVFVDKQEKLADDPTVLLGKEDYVGQINIQSAQWKIGFPNAEVVSGKDLQVE